MICVGEITSELGVFHNNTDVPLTNALNTPLYIHDIPHTNHDNPYAALMISAQCTGPSALNTYY